MTEDEIWAVVQRLKDRPDKFVHYNEEDGCVTLSARGFPPIEICDAEEIEALILMLIEAVEADPEFGDDQEILQDGNN